MLAGLETQGLHARFSSRGLQKDSTTVNIRHAYRAKAPSAAACGNIIEGNSGIWA